MGDLKNLALMLMAFGFCGTVLLALGQPRPVGGLEDERRADDEVREILKKVQKEIAGRYPERIQSIEPISYRTQLVAGRNYFVRALVHEADGDKRYAHLRIYRSFRGPVELVAIKTNVEKGQPLSYFQ